jgi:predicted MFS family arabinose efflux permease
LFTRAKRGVVVAALTVLALAALVIFTWPSFGPVLAANTIIALVGDVFGPAVAALTLGLFAARQLPRQMGRNCAFDHAGNVAIAAIAGVIGWLFGQRAVFLLVPVFAVMATLAVLSIPAAAIDHGKARGAKADVATGISAQEQPVNGAASPCFSSRLPFCQFGLSCTPYPITPSG